MITASTQWPTGPVTLEWHPSESTELPVTGSHGFIFGDTGVLVVLVRSRGYTVPGGHIEPGENPGQCLIRETREEAYTSVSQLSLLGYIVSDHTVNPEYRGSYPIRAAQAVFAAKIAEFLQFRPTDEVSERLEVPAKDLPTLHHEWNSVLNAAFEAAKNANARELNS